MATSTIEYRALQNLAGALSGGVVTPDDADYDEARRVHNGLVDKRPALIARCLGTADVAAALAFARAHGLDVAIRSGGHSVAGLSATEGGLLVDLSGMKGIHVDPERRTVRAQAGVLWGELNRETGAHGLAVTGGVVSTTGIAGLTLGGGLGWLMGAYGLAADNLLSAQLVDAVGTVRTASPDADPDLFWALRGGGGSFGVVTSLEYRLHPVATVLGGLVAFPYDDARRVLRGFREVAGSAPDELGLIAALVHAPDGSDTPLAAVAVCHCGPPARAEEDVAGLLALATPVLSRVGRIPYPDVNTMLDGGYPAGALNYWKSSFLRELSDDVIDLVVERFATAPSPMTQLAIEAFGGAATRVGVTETAVPHREPGFNLLLTSVWQDGSATAENVEWTRGVYGALDAHLEARRYVNYLDRDDLETPRAAYGPNVERLRELKRRYDPDGVFRGAFDVSGRV